MASQFTILTHKIAIQLHLVVEILPFAVLAPGGQSGNFWIHPCISGEAYKLWRSSLYLPS